MTQMEEDLRDKVLQASVALIEEQGLAGLSMREVARRAGVSHQAPYHHFEGREAILAALCKEGFDILRKALTKARKRASSIGEELENASIAYVRFAWEHPAHFRVMFRPELVEIDKYAEVDASAEDAFSHVPEMVMRMLGAGFPTGIAGNDALATMLWSFVHGFACLLLDGPLSKKLPGIATDRERVFREVAHTFRVMVEATIEQNQKAKKRPRMYPVRDG